MSMIYGVVLGLVKENLSSINRRYIGNAIKVSHKTSVPLEWSGLVFLLKQCFSRVCTEHCNNWLIGRDILNNILLFWYIIITFFLIFYSGLKWRKDQIAGSRKSYLICGSVSLF